MTPIWKSFNAKFYFINLSIHQDPITNWRLPFKIQNFAHFSLVSLNVYPRSRRGAEGVRQGDGRWSRPPKTTLERSDSTEKFQFRESHTEADTKKTPDQIRVPSKKYQIIIYIFVYTHPQVLKYFMHVVYEHFEYSRYWPIFLGLLWSLPDTVLYIRVFVKVPKQFEGSLFLYHSSLSSSSMD